MVVQIIGFIIGVGLLIWCIANAIRSANEEGGWERLAEADPLLIIGLLSCTVASLIANGAIFFVTIQPVRRLRFLDLQLVNACAAILNFAPIRLGLVARAAYHLRVDRLTFLTVGAWFAAIAFLMVACLAVTAASLVIRPSPGFIWLVVLIVLLVTSGLIIRALMGNALLVRHGRGMEQMLRHPLSLWGGLALRMIDVAAFMGRMWFAAEILGIALSGGDRFMLGLVAFAGTLIPLGRVGYREFAVGVVGGFLLPHLSSAELGQGTYQLSIIESAGEAIVFIPMGALALLWYRKKWIAAGRRKTIAQVEVEPRESGPV